MCDSGYNSAFTEDASWDGLIACGPGGEYRYENESGSPLPENWEWECVELSERWLYQEFGLPEQSANGYQVVSAYSSYIESHSSNDYPLTPVTPSSATAGSLGPGDVVSFADVDGDDGHTDVVTATSPAPFDGNGTITTINENTGGLIKMDVSNWQFGVDDLNGHKMAATGWLHYTGNSSTATATNLLTSASFEEDSAAGWDLTTDANEALYDNGTAHEGAYYLEMNTGTAGSGASLWQDVALNTTAGQSFAFSAWLRSPSGAAAGVCVVLWGLGGTQEGGASQQSCTTLVGTAWTLVTVPLDTHASAHTTLRAQIYMYTAGINYDVDGTTFAAGGAQISPPGAPTGVSAVAGNASASVSWSPPAQTGGGPIVGYTVTASPGGASATTSGTSATVTGLANGTAYTFTVTAASSAGPGPPSGSSNAVTPHVPVTVTSVKPASLGQGASDVTVTVTGTNFQSGATVTTTATGVKVGAVTVKSSTDLTVKLTAPATTTIGSYGLSVTNTDTGQGSCTNCLTIADGPTLTSVKPSRLAPGAHDTVLTLTGSDFLADSKVTVSGTGVTIVSVSYASSTRLRVTVEVSSTAAAGHRTLTVTNPDHGRCHLTDALTVT
jgi:hypothetical protein